ncbi:MAG: UvrD-helicase domain-containing protein, partial [Clostridia bacterium]|nr:UvrD-helicase domain-containing protein [Clostridia bacterium]
MELLDDLNEAQQQVVTHPGGPLLVLAGAGSGKTRVLTRRVAYLLLKGVSPHRILAITFTNKAAREMRDRLVELVGPVAQELWVSTFHSACVRILRRHAEAAGYGRNFVIFDTDDQRTVVRNCLRELGLNDRQWPPGAVLAAIGRAKDALLDPDALRARARGFRDHQLADIYERYQEALRRNNALDFDDLIAVTVRLLEEHPDIGEAWADRFQHICVDEYQDTNRAQYRLVRRLAERHRNLLAVGDADQSIFGWRGADLTNILDFEADFPDARVVKLEQNYRSTGTILAAADQVIARNRMRRERRLWTQRGSGEPIGLIEAWDEVEEAEAVAGECQRLVLAEGYRWGDIAVLYRTHAQSRPFEEVFLRRGLPYRIVGGLKFYDRKEVKDLLAYLRLIVNPADAVSLERIANVPRRGVGPASLGRLSAFAAQAGLPVGLALERASEVPGLGGGQAAALAALGRLLAEWRRLATALPPFELIQDVLDRSGYREALVAEGTLEAQTRLENLEELLTVAREFQALQPDGNLEDFLAAVALVADTDMHQEGEDAVTLMTLHASKGLEFPVVFLAGMEEGVFPHARSLDEPAELEEERRLCYVGMTRAQDRLYLSYARRRTLFGGLREAPPARFLREFEPSLTVPVLQRGGAGGRAGTARPDGE